MPSATEIELVRGLGIDDQVIETINELIAAIIEGADLPFVIDEEGTEKAVLEQLARAETPEQLFGDQATSGWGEQMLDVPVEVHGFRLRPSELEGAKCYAVVHAYRLDEGEPIVLTTSAKGVVVQLLRAVQLQCLGGPYKLVEVGKEVKGRSRPQRLVRLGDRASSG